MTNFSFIDDNVLIYAQLDGANYKLQLSYDNENWQSYSNFGYSILGVAINNIGDNLELVDNNMNVFYPTTTIKSDDSEYAVGDSGILLGELVFLHSNLFNSLAIVEIANVKSNAITTFTAEVEDIISEKLDELNSTDLANNTNCILNIKIATDEDYDDLQCYIEICENSNFDEVIELNTTDHADIMEIIANGTVYSVANVIPAYALDGVLVVNLAQLEQIDCNKIYYARAKFSDGIADSYWGATKFYAQGYIN